ncbi:MAG: nucleotidyltransferase family protein [Castellaniella sp.]|uniref:N-acetylmuramate alpha-1-phosphate uridylyltransferase MurU n=1 Tax=Castellaniella sp. TaxID=1955812 RepID=UPI0012083786|nr:nucleotidyltransferase family protein [Castellaniella sp.]TAN28963.1 MAG: nucleotidyltransferase family protein [Castellaniella sp.]
MRAMILAAGRGERMRPLTDTCPKPLLPVGGHPLIVWHIRRLVQAGFRDIVINHAWLGDQITAALGNGQALGARLHYSPESPALETAGGIAHTLHFFQGEPFLVVNGDIWCDWDPARAHAQAARLSAEHPAHLVLVDNPGHHPQGDFVLQADGRVVPPGAADAALTFAGIGLYHPSLFTDINPELPAPLAPLLRSAMADRLVTGEHHAGQWADIGTPQRLAQLDRALRNQLDPG